MHELSLAATIVEEIKDFINKNNVNSVRKVNIVVGKMSGVEIEPLKFAIETLIEDTFLAKTIFEIKRLDCIVECLCCNKQTILQKPFVKCAYCNSRNVKIVQGKEFKIKSMEVEYNV